MKQINRCPNCGGLLPKSRTNTVKCEYCDSVFENIPSDEPIAISNIDVDEYLKQLEAERPFRITSIEPYRDEKGRLHASQQTSATLCVAPKIQIDAGYMTTHSNACNTKNFQLESGHTVTHFGNNYIVHANSPKDNRKDLMAEMKEAVLKHNNITMPRGVNPFAELYVEMSDHIDDSYRLPDPIEKQWKVRCIPW